MPNRMRAIVADAPGGPEALHLTELPVPEPDAGQVRLRVAYCGMNPLDVFARAGRVNWMPVSWPFVPGLEHTGLVEAVGPGVSETLVGRRVIARGAFGGCAEFSIASAAALVRLPDGIGWRLGTVFRGCSYTAWHLLHMPPPLAVGQHAVFHSAAGPVGIMLTQIAKERGAIVHGLAGGSRKLEYAARFGADHLIDYRAGDWSAEVLRLTGGRGADLIVDGNGGPEAVKNYPAIAPLGRVVYIGATAGLPPPDVPVPLLIGRSFSVCGFSLPYFEKGKGAAEIPEITEAVRSGRWRVPIGEEVALEEAPALHARFEARALMGRAIIRVGGEL